MFAKVLNRVIKSLGFRFRRRADGLRRAFRVAFPCGLASKIVCVEQFSPDGDSEYELYQKYYENSICELVHFCKSKSGELFAPHTTHVGQYLFRLRCGDVIKVAIDAHDHRSIRSQVIHDWSDIYFKSNRWPNIDYGLKVLPLPIGNAGITIENCRFLKSYRGLRKEWDLVFVGRIWAGGDANVEHNLRLFENLSKVKCKSKLVAVVFNFDKKSIEFKNIIDRLDKAGVEWTEKQIGYKELIKLSAMSRLVIIRAGISGCISWRVVDMLAIGACIVLDREPFPEWPFPLKEDENFLNLDLGITEDCHPATENDYHAISHKVKSFLACENKSKKIGQNNGFYFDSKNHPLSLSAYLLERILTCNALQ